MFLLPFPSQMPELYGPVRTVAEGKGSSVLIGTTRNYILQGTLSGAFTPITQVRQLGTGNNWHSPENDIGQWSSTVVQGVLPSSMTGEGVLVFVFTLISASNSDPRNQDVMFLYIYYFLLSCLSCFQSVLFIPIFCLFMHSCSPVMSLCFCWIWVRARRVCVKPLFGYFQILGIFQSLPLHLVFWSFPLLY